MSKQKHIAQSLKTLMKNPMVEDTLDLTRDILPIAEAATFFWNYDLTKRKPSPAYNEYGLFQGTDLDLACFLYSLVGRGAVINIPQYKSMRQKKEKKDQVISSKYNRHGKITGVQANKNFWSFSINVIDENVIGEDKVGDFRTFSLTDLDGTWYDGWDKIEFVPTLKENRFITENKLWSGNSIVFHNMIHPNRWTSFFGHHYIISKLIIERLTHESKYLNSQIKEMKEEGIEFPEGEGPQIYEYVAQGDKKSIKKNAFEARIYIPESNYVGEYPKPKHNQETIVGIYNKRKTMQKYIKKLRFMTRATEFAHAHAPDNLPAWIKGVKWEPDFKISSRSRTKWERLPLFQTGVGEFSVAILRRWYEKSTMVDIDY